MVNIQIFGSRKCQNTKKAERFFKERRIPFHLVNLQEKGISPGELKSVLGSIPAGELIDTESPEYKKQNLEYMKFSIPDKLLESPLLMKTPVIRNGKKCSCGFVPDVWEQWIREDKSN